MNTRQPTHRHRCHIRLALTIATLAAVTLLSTACTGTGMGADTNNGMNAENGTVTDDTPSHDSTVGDGTVGDGIVEDGARIVR